MRFVILFLMLISTAQADVVTDFQNHIGGNSGGNNAQYNTGANSNVSIKIPKKPLTTVPLPATVWMFGAGLLAFLKQKK